MPSITTLALASLAIFCTKTTAQSLAIMFFPDFVGGGGGDNGSGSSKTAAPTPERTVAILGVDGSGHTTYEESDYFGPATIVADASYVSYDVKFDPTPDQGFTQPIACSPAAGYDGKKTKCVYGIASSTGSALATIIVPATQVVIEIASTTPRATASAGGSGSTQSQPSNAYPGKNVSLPSVFLGIILWSVGWMLLLV